MLKKLKEQIRQARRWPIKRWQDIRVRYAQYKKKEQAHTGFSADSNLRNLSRPAFFTHVILGLAVVFIILLFLIAQFTVLDEVTSGEGKVIPSSQIQLIQNLEGGIVRKMFVREGQVVEKDQILMQIDDTNFKAKWQEAKAKEVSLKIKIARLYAEVQNKPFRLEGDLIKRFPKEARDAKLLYESRSDQYRQLKQRYQLAQRELALSLPLLKKGATSKVEILQQRRLVSELHSEVLDFQALSLKDILAAKTELAAIEEANVAHEDRFKRTTVRSPVRGIIKVLNNNTIGGVIKAGDTVMEIVPLDDTLLIEAKIRPADIGFIHPKQKAQVKISAYEYGVYGSLNGVVEQISADTITDEKDDKPYYLIRVRTQKSNLGDNVKPLHIIPGMHATVDIMTGQKSLFDYLLKPILKTRSTGPNSLQQ